MRELFRDGLRLGESLARMPWRAARRLVHGKSETLERAADLGERLGTLPFRAVGELLEEGGPSRTNSGAASGRAPVRRAGPDAGRGGGQGEPSPAGSKGRIAVLGAGYAGLTCFLELQDHLPHGYDLVLVNGDRYHWFTTELHTYVAGTTEDAVRIPLKRLLTRGRLIVDRVVRVDAQAQQAELKLWGPLPYDILVFALGSDPEYYGLPGVKEHSLPVGNWHAAAKLRQRLQQLLDAGRSEERCTPRIVIAGGGLTGVEVAGELADEYPGRLRLTILEAGPEIMAGFPPELVDVSHSVLEEKGIRILTGSPIVAVDETAVHLKNDHQIGFDLLIWAAGVRGSGVLAGSGLETTPRGRARVDAYLRSVSDDRVYVVGDSASFTDPETGREIPPTGQAAVQMGQTAGRNILRRLRGQAETEFTYRKRGMFASLGRREGVGQIGKEYLAGLPAMLVKHMIEGYHAWEMGSGVMPLVRRLIQTPAAYVVGRRSNRPLADRGGATNPGVQPPGGRA